MNNTDNTDNNKDDDVTYGASSSIAELGENDRDFSGLTKNDRDFSNVLTPTPTATAHNPHHRSSTRDPP